MSDAQVEAEQAVRAVEDEMAWRVVARVPEAREYRDRLVAALAAAIDHVQTNSDVPDDYSVGAWDMDADTFRALRAALSALRQTDGEETS